MIFVKGYGIQNDFVLLFDVDVELVFIVVWVVVLCDWWKGLGVDGVLWVMIVGVVQVVGVLDSLFEGVCVIDWYMDYCNVDGLVVQMCGNGV